MLALLSVASRTEGSGGLEVGDGDAGARLASIVIQEGRIHLVRTPRDEGAIHDLLRRWSPATLDVLRGAVYEARTDGRPLEEVLEAAGGRHLDIVRTALEQVLARQILAVATQTIGHRLVLKWKPLDKGKAAALGFDIGVLYQRIVGRLLPPPEGSMAEHFERVAGLADVAVLVSLDERSAALPLRFSGTERFGLSEVARLCRSVAPLARPPSLMAQGIAPNSTLLSHADGTWLCMVSGATACLTRHSGARPEDLLPTGGPA